VGEMLNFVASGFGVDSSLSIRLLLWRYSCLCLAERDEIIVHVELGWTERN
jgi:hypothetical protein